MFQDILVHVYDVDLEAVPTRSCDLQAWERCVREWLFLTTIVMSDGMNRVSHVPSKKIGVRRCQTSASVFVHQRYERPYSTQVFQFSRHESSLFRFGPAERDHKRGLKLDSCSDPTRRCDGQLHAVVFFVRICSWLWASGSWGWTVVCFVPGLCDFVTSQ